MSAIISFSLDVKKLPKHLFKPVGDKVYLNLTMSINDETNQYGQNVGVYVPQTQEEREAKKQRTYLGNGKVVWNNGSIQNAVKQESVEVNSSPQTVEADGLPF